MGFVVVIVIDLDMYVCMARYDMVLVSKARARARQGGFCLYFCTEEATLFSVQTSVRGLSLVLFFFLPETA